MKFSIQLIAVLALRNIWRNPRRTILTLVAMTLAVWSTISLSALARGISNSIISDTLGTLTGHIQIHAPHYRDDPIIGWRFSLSNTLSERLTSDARSWAARVRVPGMIASERDTLGITILGIDPSQEQDLSFIGHSITVGRPLSSSSDTGILIGKRAAERLRTGLGRRVVLMSQSAQEGVADRGFVVIGIFDAELEATELSYAFIGKSVAQHMLGIPDGATSEISLLLKEREDVEREVKSLRQDFPSLDIAPWQDLEPFLTALVTIQNGFIVLWIIIVTIAVSFGLMNTLFMSIFDRTREIGMVRALGMRRIDIITLILTESLCLLVLSTVLGVLLSILAIEYFHSGIDVSIFAEGAAKIGLRSVIVPIYRLDDWITALTILFCVGSLSTLYPAVRAAELSPQEALRNE